MPVMPDLATFSSRVGADGPRAIGSYDLSPLARGNAAIQSGVETLGKGVQAVGTDIKDVKDSNDQYQYAVAKASFNIDHTNLQQSLAHDQDYPTLQPRYMEGAQAAQSKWADTLTNPGLKARFNAETGQTIASGDAAAKSQAWSLEGNTKLADIDDRGKELSDAAIANPMNEKQFGSGLEDYGAMVDSMVAKGWLTPTQAAQKKDAWAHSAGVGVGLARADIDPTGALNEVRAMPGSPDQVTNRIMLNEGPGKDPRSSAVGGFIDSRWLELLKANRPDLAQGKSDADLLALRADAGLRKEMTDANVAESAAYLKGQGLEATPGNIYLSHFLGKAGAAAVLKANPNQPVADVLAGLVGPQKAQAMIDANPTVLQGKLAGSVVGWANGKMGGVSPGGDGHIYDWLDDNQRRQIASYAQAKLEANNLDLQSTLKQRVEDTASEAARTGYATNPVSQSEFVAAKGLTDGPKAYAQYQAGLKTAADISNVARMTADQQNELVKSYEPKPGEGYEAAAERQDAVKKQVIAVRKERDADPAAFAINRIPAVKAAFDNFDQISRDPTSTPEAKQLAARDYVNKTTERQIAAGVDPSNVTIAPAGYIGKLSGAITDAATSEDPKARVNVIARIGQEASLWGDAWPLVARQLPAGTVPIVRGIAAATDANAPQAAVETAKAAYARLLTLGPKDNPAALLKEQSETKFGDLQKALNTTMAPFHSTLVGSQRERDFNDYYGMAEKLAALYVRDGKDATTAASDAFNALLGNRYDFRDGYRIPKTRDQSYSADDVQAGALVAKTMLVAPAAQGNLLEQARAQYPILKNQDYGYVENFKPNAGFLEHWEPGEAGAAPTAPGSLDSLRPKDLPLDRPGLEIRDRNTRPIDVLGDIVSHNLVNTDPVVKQTYDKLQASMTPAQEKILRDQYEYAQDKEGERRSFYDWRVASGMPGLFRGYTFQQWPKEFSDKAYTPEQRADLDKLMGYLSKGGSSGAPASGLTVKPAIDDVGGLTNAAGDSVAAFRRDGVWVTSPGNDGLNLMYGDKSVRSGDGTPLHLTWAKLAQLGGTPAARAAAVSDSLRESGVQP